MAFGPRKASGEICHGALAGIEIVMALHLIKLCVGAESVVDLQAHVTRMTPKRSAELLDGGSLYWVIKGQLCARQKLVGLEPFVDTDGIKRCALQLNDEVVAVTPR